MEKLIEKVENLKNEILKEPTVVEIKKLKEDISKDEKLMTLLTQYHETHSEKIKDEIIKNPIFRKYKEKETDINILIYKINQELEKIIKKDKCSL